MTRYHGHKLAKHFHFSSDLFAILCLEPRILQELPRSRSVSRIELHHLRYEGSVWYLESLDFGRRELGRRERSPFLRMLYRLVCLLARQACFFVGKFQELFLDGTEVSDILGKDQGSGFFTAWRTVWKEDVPALAEYEADKLH